ncbi:hypothetical protein LDENG_00285950 [Lucifuga dentata]|nr:hypothetical protein LDENG_00285950 [Lucifuga dentata]
MRVTIHQLQRHEYTVTESIKDVALLRAMTRCCITNRHGIAQINVITKEIRTNSQQPSYLFIRQASKQKCCKTQITQSGFNRPPHRFQPHKNPDTKVAHHLKTAHPPFFLCKEFNDIIVQYIAVFQFQKVRKGCQFIHFFSSSFSHYVLKNNRTKKKPKKKI